MARTVIGFNNPSLASHRLDPDHDLRSSTVYGLYDFTNNWPILVDYVATSVGTGSCMIRHVATRALAAKYDFC